MQVLCMCMSACVRGMCMHDICTDAYSKVPGDMGVGHASVRPGARLVRVAGALMGRG